LSRKKLLTSYIFFHFSIDNSFTNRLLIINGANIID